MIFFSALLLSLSTLSVSFYLSDPVLSYASGLAALLAGLLSLRDLLLVRDILKDEVSENARTAHKWLTGFGSQVGELLNVIMYRQDSLEWKADSLSTLPGLHYNDFVHLLSDSNASAFYQELLSLISKKFRCSNCAILFSHPEINIISHGEPDLRLQDSLKLFFKEFFLSGATNKLGIRDSANDQVCLGDPVVFGYPFSLSESFLDDSQGKKCKGVIWLGYHDLPLALERAWLSDLCNMLEGELASFRKVEALSCKVKAIEEASQQKNEFISHMSHDIRSPINNIKSILHVIKLEGLSDDNRQFLEIALSNCDSASELVEDLLDYTRHQAGALKSNFQELNILEILKQVIANYQQGAQAKKIELGFFAAEDSYFVFADKLQLKRVFSNLICNSVKYTDAGKILISLKKNNGIIELSIADSGIGMSEDQLDRIFTPFTRFTSKADGIGLGLTLSKILLERNFGEIAVSSVLEEGTEFKISLPCLERKAEEIEVSAMELISKRIVFADDNPELVASMRRGFETRGWEVHQAYDADEAIRLAVKYDVDALVTDNQMPGGGAKKILESQKIFKSIPLILVVSGSSDRAVHKHLLALGADNVLIKPVTSAEIIDEILSREDKRRELSQAA